MFSSCLVFQYVYAVYFGLVGCYLLIAGGLRILTNYGVFGLDPVEVYSVQSQMSYSSSGSSSSAVVPKGFSSKKKKFNILEPGGNLFWASCIATLCIGLTLQILRCFTVTGSYATTSAEHTLAQICIMVAQVNLSLYVFYKQSNFGFTIVRFFSDMAYFIVRLSVAGNLVMHSSDFLDFLTIAISLIFCVKDIDNMTKFMRMPPGATKGKRTKSSHSIIQADSSGSIFASIKDHRGKVAISAGLVVTILGVVGFVNISNRSEECSGVPLPEGFECMDWRFNFYLDPSCSCSYLHINVPECEESKAGFQVDSFVSQDLVANVSKAEEQATPSFDHIEDSPLLVINYAPGCSAANSNHSEYISSFKDLQMVSLQVADFEELPSDLSNFPNLVAIYLNAPHLKSIESETLDACTKLQVLHCSPCPSLDLEDLLANAQLPRLESVKLEGVSTCSDDTKFGLKEQLTSYECTNRDASSVCGNMPQWILQHHLNRVQRTSSISCNEPSCGFFLDMFNAFDSTYQGAPEPDALFNAYEFVSYLKYIGFPGAEDISDESYECKKNKTNTTN